MKNIFLILLFAASTSAISKEWSCRNLNYEIHCDATKCEATDQFTPISLVIPEKGTIEVCAYEGCWSGKGKITKHNHHLMVSAMNLRWTANKKSTADFMIAIDTTDSVGVIKGEGFAMPINCTNQ